MTKEALDTLKKTTKKLRLVSLLFYAIGTLVSSFFISIKSDNISGVLILVFALFFHLISEIINKEYKDRFSKEINKNKRIIRL